MDAPVTPVSPGSDAQGIMSNWLSHHQKRIVPPISCSIGARCTATECKRVLYSYGGSIHIFMYPFISMTHLPFSQLLLLPLLLVLFKQRNGQPHYGCKFHHGCYEPSLSLPPFLLQPFMTPLPHREQFHLMHCILYMNGCTNALVKQCIFKTVPRSAVPVPRYSVPYDHDRPVSV